MRHIKTIINANRQVRVNRHEDEYQCHLYVDGVHQPKATYFTGDWDDALGTASHMVKPLVTQKIRPLAIA